MEIIAGISLVIVAVMFAAACFAAVELYVFDGALLERLSAAREQRKAREAYR